MLKWARGDDMTNQQMKVAACIQKYHSLNMILAKSNMAEEGQLEELFYPYILDFDDHEGTAEVMVTLPNELIEELEQRSRDTFQRTFT